MTSSEEGHERWRSARGSRWIDVLVHDPAPSVTGQYLLLSVFELKQLETNSKLLHSSVDFILQLVDIGEESSQYPESSADEDQSRCRGRYDQLAHGGDSALFVSLCPFIQVETLPSLIYWYSRFREFGSTFFFQTSAVPPIAKSHKHLGRSAVDSCNRNLERETKRYKDGCHDRYSL